ncbi:alpha/beta hydrolase [Catenulispora sp. NL8]|uniref:Alpha/beta hydrolase n=1 Tax=Catenulispora pinistramenti TaxID=2705254 RepID=A0ABS5L8M2_9ACTN|nr:alpha/beta hydrolase [Catenulispora pinistramenti]MBS2554686.1 alpha/beta hydrolase [Catenulispora pinistramenti]
MRFTSQTSSDGVTEQPFILDGTPGRDDLPGVLWTPEGATGPRPLILLGHGGDRHKQAPEIVARARRFVTEGGFAVVAVDAPGHGDRPVHERYNRIATQSQARMAAGEHPAQLMAEFHVLVAQQTVPEWRAVLDAVQHHLGPAPVGYWGVSLGCGLGVPFVAAEPRVRAAVFGLGGAHANADQAARISVPVQFLVQWDDERVPRDQSLALFDALGSAEKTLHAHSGGHGDLPQFETDDALLFLTKHLSPRGVDVPEADVS